MDEARRRWLGAMERLGTIRSIRKSLIDGGASLEAIERARQVHEAARLASEAAYESYLLAQLGEQRRTG